MPPPPLDSFLSSLGANNLSTQLIPTQTKGQAARIHDEIDQELDNVNDQTLALIKDNWENFNSQLDKGDDILAQLEKEESELKSLEQELDGPDAFLPPLLSHLESHQSLVAAHLLSTHTVTLVSSLLTFHTTISTLSESITSGQLYPTAITHLKESIRAVEEGAEDWIEETELWKSLVKWQGDEQSRFETTLQNSFESAFDFKLPASGGNDSVSTLLLKSDITAAPTGPNLPLTDILRAIDELAQLTGKQSKVEGLLARIAKQVLRGFVAPFLEANGPIRWDGEGGGGDEKPKLRFTFPDSSEVGVKMVRLEPAGDNSEEQDPINGLSTFLSFFTQHSSLFPEPSSRYTSLFTASLTPSLQSHLITSHLVPSLPSSSSSLSSYMTLLARSTSFESSFLPSHHFFAFLPPSSSSEESHILSTWSKSLPLHYARALSDRALARVRNQVKSWDWGSEGGEMVEVEVREEEEMEGLLRGLELGLNEHDESANEEENREKKRRTELETVPKGAKREMTLEEATAPRPPRKPRTPTPPPPPPAPVPIQIEPEVVEVQRPTTPPTASLGRKNKMKLGASKINKDTKLFLPPSSPSPPPMFQGDDLIAPPPPSSSQQLDPPPQDQDRRTPILSPRPISIPSAASFTHAQNDEEVHDIVERAQRSIAEEGEGIFEPLEEIRQSEEGGKGVEMLFGEGREGSVEDYERQIKEEEEQNAGGMRLTEEALEKSQEPEMKDEKPFIKKEESVEPVVKEEEEQEPQPVLVEIVEPDSEDIKREIKEEEQESIELEQTPQVGDFEPTPQPPQVYSEENYEPPRFEQEESSYAPPPTQGYEVEDHAPKVEEREEPDQSYNPEPEYAPLQQQDRNSYGFPRPASTLPPPVPIAPVEEESTYLPTLPPPPPRSQPQTIAALPSPQINVPPPPRSNPVAPPPPRSNSSVPHPPRAQYAPAPPRSQGILSPPPSQNRPISPAQSIPAPPRPASATRSPGLPPQPQRSPLVSPQPPLLAQTNPPLELTSSYAPPPQRGPASIAPPTRSVLSPPPPRQGVLSPPPPSNTSSARASPSYPRQMPPPITSPFASSSRSAVSPRPPSRNQDGPILNHIQQRFVSPPPSHVNPYAPFPVPAPPPTHQQQSYIPANDPMLADLFGSSSASSSSSKKPQAPAAYFTPDPPGRQQRSNSTSSQGSNMSMGGGYRPSSRGSQHQQPYAPNQPPHMFAQPQQQYNPQQGGWGSQQQDEMEELEDRYSPSGYGNYGQEPMRLRGGAYLSDSESEDEDEYVAMRLRGGATLDLGDMDEDEGNKSGDDWGFGDDVGIEEGGGDEDAWGFGGDDEPQPPTPSPPILRNPPPKPPSLPTSPVKPTFSNPTSPIRSSFTSATSPIRSNFTSPAKPIPSFVPSHASSASISSVSSQTSTLSRPPSYSFTSSLAPPISTTSDLEPAEEETEEGEDAWGFDEELEAESPPIESEEVHHLEEPAELASSSPVVEEEPLLPVEQEIEAPLTPEIIHQVVVDKVDVLPPVSLASTQKEEVEEVVSEPSTEVPVESHEEVDEWGFSANVVESQETSPAQFAVPLPETVEPVIEHNQEAEIVPVEGESELIEPLPTQEDSIIDENAPQSPIEMIEAATSLPDEQVLQEEIVPLERELEESTPAEEPVIAMSAEGPIIINDVVSADLESPKEVTPSDPFPVETPALDDAEEGHGWDLEEPPVEEPVSLPSPTPTPALDVAEEGQSIEGDGWNLEEPVAELEQPQLSEPAQESTIEESATPLEVPPADTPALDDAEFGQAPIEVPNESSLAIEQAIEQEEEIPPASTPALEQAEEGINEEGWDLDEKEETSTQLTEPTLVDVDSDQPAPPVISSPALKARDDEGLDEAPSTEASEVPAFPLTSNVTLPAGPKTPAPVEPSSTGLEFEMNPVEDLQESTRSVEEEQPIESALTAPAETLQEQAFPLDPRSQTETSIDSPLPSSPTPTLPEPMPHSDESEPSHIARDAFEQSIQEVVAPPADEANLLGLESGEDEDGWGIEGEEEETVESGLTGQEEFKPEEVASRQEERDLPIEETLLNPTSLEESTPIENDESYPDHIDSRRSSEDNNPYSPSHSDTVMVEPMSSSNSSRGTQGERNMSSPEVIEKSDAWGFDLEEGGEGAEILEEDQLEEESIESEDRSTVQHEDERPILHKESAVQHIEERPVVEDTPVESQELEIAATQPQAEEHTFSLPLDSLPASTAEPSTWEEPESQAANEPLAQSPAIDTSAQEIISRSASPSPAAIPSPLPATEEDAVADDPWDLDLEESTVPPPFETTETFEVQQEAPLEVASPTFDSLRSENVEQSQGPTDSLDSSWNTFDVEEPERETALSLREDSATSPQIDPPSVELQVVEEASRYEPLQVREDVEEPRVEVEEEMDEESRSPAQEEEGWGWDESADQEATPEPEPTEPKEEESIVAPLAEAAAAVSAIAVGTAAALGFTTNDRSPSPPLPSKTKEPISTAPVAPEQTSELSVSHPDAGVISRQRSSSTASAEGWGWDGEDKEEPEETDEIKSREVPVETSPPTQVTAPNEIAPVDSTPPVRLEKMMVSKRSREIVKIAEEVLVEALTVASPSFEHPQFSAASAPLLSTFVSLLSLYRATAAVHNSTLLASVPAIGMQFANDADWIGREVERVWMSRTEGKDLQVSSEQAEEVELAIQSTRQLGRDTRQKQIAIQRGALMESLDEASGFLRTSDDSRYATCERALQQVTHTLQRLALVWKPVMTPTALYTTLGGLVNEVLLRVLDEIEDQTDISEEESIRLNRLCKMLHELESLFEGSETSVGREVPIWFKFVFLSELLEASMADILFLFDHGHLVDFSPQEIVRLIRALFSDSPLRNRNVEKILAGHPAVSPDEEEDEFAPF